VDRCWVNLGPRGGGITTNSLLQIFTHDRQYSRQRTRSSPDMFLLALPLTRTMAILVKVVLAMTGATVAGEGEESMIPLVNSKIDISNTCVIDDKELQNACMKLKLLVVQIHRLLVHLGGHHVSGTSLGILDWQQVWCQDDSQVGGSHLVLFRAPGHRGQVVEEEGEAGQVICWDQQQAHAQILQLHMRGGGEGGGNDLVENTRDYGKGQSLRNCFKSDATSRTEGGGDISRKSLSKVSSSFLITFCLAADPDIL